MRVSVMGLCLILATAAAAAHGDDPIERDRRPAAIGKAAWEWTHDERVARRFDRSQASARRAAAIAEGQVDPDSDWNVVVGDHDPELLMAWELMDRLIVAYTFRDDAVKRRSRRRWFESGAAPYAGADFYARLQEVMQPLIDATSELERLQLRKNTAEGANDIATEEQWGRANDAICPSRAKALSRAREIFGRANFDRFLYEVVAPGAVVLTSSTSAESRADLDLWVEGGCQ